MYTQFYNNRTIIKFLKIQYQEYWLNITKDLSTSKVMSHPDNLLKDTS